MLASILLDLTLTEVLTGIPHDAASVVVYTLVSIFVGLTIAGGRRKPQR